MNIDWGQLAVAIVVLKGLWDIWKERRKPALDLSTFDTNVAQAANISVKSLLEAMAQLQKRLDTVEASERRIRTELQHMGLLMTEARHNNEILRGLLERVLSFAQGLIGVLHSNNIETDIKVAELERFREEFARTSTEPK